MICTTKNYSIADASRELDIHRSTIHRWVKEGKIKYGIHLVNGRVFINGQELIKVINS